MYGDCQVMSSMVGGGGGMSPDSLFSSQPTITNPNGTAFLTGMPPFHAFSSIVPKAEEAISVNMVSMRAKRGKEEELESGSGSGYVEGASCDDEQSTEPSQRHPQPPSKKKRYHRHTAHQIQVMEAMFKEYQHPDEKQRTKLSQDLGLKPRQVKFWFQNRRTQMKAHTDRADNQILRAENESLKAENFRLQASIRNVICPSCGAAATIAELPFDEHNLRLENARLKDEVERVSCLIARHVNRPMHPLGPGAPPLVLPSLDLDMNIYSRHFSEPPMGSLANSITAPPMVNERPPFPDILIHDRDKPMAFELAMTAAEHLVRMCTTNEPLWLRGGAGEAMDVDEHRRMFQWPVELSQWGGDIRTECTRDTALVIMNSITLVDAFLDANKWMELFPSIVSKAKTVQIITPGISCHGNGSLHLMYAELQVLSPLVPTRESYFFRYCHQNAEDGTWTIVDFPIDGFHDGHQQNFPRFRRRPSGCIIQDMPNGYSRVMWAEHVEVEDKPVHQIFNRFVNSGMAFGASRWLSLLQRQCERLASLMATNISDLGVFRTPEARKNMLKLSQRMIRTFCANMISTASQPWSALSESSNDTTRVTSRKNTEPGQPNGIILTAVSTTWLPVSHLQVFDLLTDDQNRSQLDLLYNGNTLQEFGHIANGSHPRNCVSLLRVNATNSSPNVELVLQESSTHPSGGSLIVYASFDVVAIQVAMSGEDPSYIPLLPAGFVLWPAFQPDTDSSSGGATPGCLLQVGLQVLTGGVTSGKLNLTSMTAINNHLYNIVHQISVMLGVD